MTHEHDDEIAALHAEFVTLSRRVDAIERLIASGNLVDSMLTERPVIVRDLGAVLRARIRNAVIRRQREEAS